VEVPHPRYYPGVIIPPVFSEPRDAWRVVCTYIPLYTSPNTMFAARSIRPVASVARTQVAQQQSAGMATLKELDQRLKSVRNIEKITKVSVTSSRAVDSMGCLDWMERETYGWIEGMNKNWRY
jgi:hypothetical protein